LPLPYRPAFDSVKAWFGTKAHSAHPRSRELIEDRPSRHRVEQHPAQHLRIATLHFFHLRSQWLRQTDPQLDGTRFPHTLRLGVSEISTIFSKLPRCAVGVRAIASTCLQAPPMIVARSATVKPFRNRFTAKPLRPSYRKTTSYAASHNGSRLAKTPAYTPAKTAVSKPEKA
jgi:hypothetical protein